MAGRFARTAGVEVVATDPAPSANGRTPPPPPAPPSRLGVRGLSKRYGADGGGVDEIDLDVGDGEIVALLGPSGSGKSTILKCIAGLERPDAGEVAVAGRVLSSTASRTFLPPEKRGVSVVFQSLALWPHMTVFDNVAYPLASAKVPKAEISQRVVDIMDLVGCGHLLSRKPGEISGGEQQRVACARALVGRPSVVLFDEPFSSLDAALRNDLRRWLLALRDETGLTGVFVTHDQEEAFMVGDRVAVLFDGRLTALGTPRELHEHPPLERVATFLGTMNLVDATVAGVGGGTVELRSPLGELVAPASAAAGPGMVSVGDELRLGIRPARVGIGPADQGTADRRHGGPNRCQGTVSFARFVGTNVHYEVVVGETTIQVTSPDALDHQVGEVVAIDLPPSRLRLFPAS